MMIECNFSAEELDAIQTALKQGTETKGQEWFEIVLESVRHQRAYGKIKKEPPTTMVTATVRGAERNTGSEAIIHA